MNISRRNFLKNAAGILVAAPMVVKAENIMRVATLPPTLPPTPYKWLTVMDERIRADCIDFDKFYEYCTKDIATATHIPFPYLRRVNGTEGQWDGYIERQQRRNSVNFQWRF